MAAEGGGVSVIGRRMPEEPRSEIARIHFWMADLLVWKDLSKTLKEIIDYKGKLTNLIFSQRFRGEIKTSLTATKNVIEGSSS
jgi:hypothetical protein